MNKVRVEQNTLLFHVMKKSDSGVYKCVLMDAERMCSHSITFTLSTYQEVSEGWGRGSIERGRRGLVFGEGVVCLRGRSLFSNGRRGLFIRGRRGLFTDGCILFTDIHTLTHTHTSHTHIHIYTLTHTHTYKHTHSMR